MRTSEVIIDCGMCSDWIPGLLERAWRSLLFNLVLVGVFFTKSLNHKQNSACVVSLTRILFPLYGTFFKALKIRSTIPDFLAVLLICTSHVALLSAKTGTSSIRRMLAICTNSELTADSDVLELLAMGTLSRNTTHNNCGIPPKHPQYIKLFSFERFWHCTYR